MTPSATLLSAEEREALDDFAAAHGRSWRIKLQLNWQRAGSAWTRDRPNGFAVLLRLRNSTKFGPRGLVSYRPSKVLSFERQLERYLAEPSLARWETLHACTVPGLSVLLWQSWRSLDADANAAPGNHGVSSFPTAPTLRRALDLAQRGHLIP